MLELGQCFEHDVTVAELGLNNATQWSWVLVLIEVSGIYLVILDAGCYLLSWVCCNCAPALDVLVILND